MAPSGLRPAECKHAAPAVGPTGALRPGPASAAASVVGGGAGVARRVVAVVAVPRRSGAVLPPQGRYPRDANLSPRLPTAGVGLDGYSHGGRLHHTGGLRVDPVDRIGPRAQPAAAGGVLHPI